MTIFLRTLVVHLLAIASASASAQPFPNRPVRIVIGFPPGGGIDIVARLIAPKLGEALGQPVIVENKPGANGVIATDFVAKSPADGHTIFFGTTGNISVNPVFVQNLPFSIERDFAPLTQVSTVSFLLYANPSLPARTLPELIAYAKANPGKVSFYSSGNGGLPHLAGELLNTLAGIKALHVPYKGSAPGLSDLMGGQVQYGFDAVAIGLPHVKSGKLRALATTGPARLAILPDVPAAKESVPGFEAVNWYGMLVPAGTPADVITRLHAEIARIIHSPDIKEKLVAQGTDPVGSPPAEFGAFLKAEMQKWGKVIRDAGIKPD